MGFTVNSFAFESLLTSAKMTSMMDNDIAVKGRTASINLLENGSFEESTLAVTGIPVGWTLVGSTNTVSITAQNSILGLGYGSNHIQMYTTATSLGFQQTITDLWPDTAYTLSAREDVTSGSGTIKTTGGASNASITVTSGVASYSKDAFFTDSSGTNVTVTILTSSGATSRFDNIMAEEGVDGATVGVGFRPDIHDQYLRAINFQDTTFTDIDYSSLKVECGQVIVSGVASVSFSTAFSKILTVTVLTETTSADQYVVVNSVGTGGFAVLKSSTGSKTVFWNAIGVL